MTSPQHPRSSGLDASARGIVVLVATVAIGVLLLANAGGSSSGTGGSGSETSAATSTTLDTSGLGIETTTAPLGSDITTTTAATGSEAREPSEVTVVVLNSAGPAGSASTTTATIEGAGYKTGTAANANDRTLAATAVYYASGYQAEATQVAALLGKEASVVTALPATAPGPGTEAANVVVVLGADTAPGGTDTSTSTTLAN